MSPLRWSHLLLAVSLFLAGCKSNPPSTSTTDAAVAATPPPSKAPELSGPALSYLKPLEDRCAWVRHPLPSGDPSPVFTFNAGCIDVTLSWSPTGKEGLVFGPSGESGPLIWRVDFAAKTGKPLDLKGVPGGTGAQGTDKPYIEQVGFDAQGRPVAIVSDVYSNRVPEKDPKGERFITFEGERFPVPEADGTPGLAIAYRLEGTEWKRFETKVSTWETAESPGSNALEAAKALYVPKSLQRGEALPGQAAAASASQRLEAELPGQAAGGKWMSLSTPGGTLHYRSQVDPEDDS
ncbi:MAG TPA: hypothetical protein VEZ71_02560, partial [Archangium sp.]|nr:hypothetical protein [Archangium sp.]